MKLVNRIKGKVEDRGPFLAIEQGDILLLDRMYNGKGTTVSINGHCMISVTKLNRDSWAIDRRTLKDLRKDAKKLKAAMIRVNERIAILEERNGVPVSGV